MYGHAYQLFKENDSLSAEILVLGKLTRHLCLQSTFLVMRVLCDDTLPFRERDTIRDNMEIGDIISLASERDTLRCITQSRICYIYLFIYMVRRTSFSARASNFKDSGVNC